MQYCRKVNEDLTSSDKIILIALLSVGLTWASDTGMQICQLLSNRLQICAHLEAALQKINHFARAEIESCAGYTQPKMVHRTDINRHYHTESTPFHRVVSQHDVGAWCGDVIPNCVKGGHVNMRHQGARPCWGKKLKEKNWKKWKEFSRQMNRVLVDDQWFRSAGWFGAVLVGDRTFQDNFYGNELSGILLENFSPL